MWTEIGGGLGVVGVVGAAFKLLNGRIDRNRDCIDTVKNTLVKHGEDIAVVKAVVERIEDKLDNGSQRKTKRRS